MVLGGSTSQLATTPHSRLGHSYEESIPRTLFPLTLGFPIYRSYPVCLTGLFNDRSTVNSSFSPTDGRIEVHCFGFDLTHLTLPSPHLSFSLAGIKSPPPLDFTDEVIAYLAPLPTLRSHGGHGGVGDPQQGKGDVTK